MSTEDTQVVAPKPATGVRGWRDPVLSLALATVAALAILRANLGQDWPLWIDEVWTGMIATQPSLRQLGDQIYNDFNGPLYYLIAWIAAHSWGVSNAALRAPAMIFAAITPLIALVPRRSLSRPVRLTWCILLAAWIPAIVYAQEARTYTLVYLLMAGANAAFVALLAQPSRKTATVWCLLCGLAVLAHYEAAFPALAQGLALVAVLRLRVVRLWPAALVLFPVAGWLLFHSPRIAVYARPDIAWQPLFTMGQLPVLYAWITSAPLLFVTLPLWLIISLPGRWPSREGAPALIAMLASFAALGAVLAIGAFRPSFTTRYLFALMPGILLGMSQFACDRGRLFRSSALLLAILFLASAGLYLLRPTMPGFKYYNLEAASAWIAEKSPETLVYLWDQSETPALSTSSLEQTGGFFLRRAGVDIPVQVLRPTRRQDPNLLFQQTATPRSAMIWDYDVTVHDTAAARWPPAALPQHECRNFGKGAFGVFTCRPR